MKSFDLKFNPEIPISGVDLIMTATKIPERNFYLSNISYHATFNGFKLPKVKREINTFYRAIEPSSLTQTFGSSFAAAGLYKIDMNSFNEFGEIVFSYDAWFNLQKKPNLVRN